MKGKFFVSRDLWADDAFGNEPFSRREAWLWMVAEASFKAREQDGLALKRGEFSHSVRFMAETFGWSRMRVQRFKDHLTERGMIAERSVAWDTKRDTKRDTKNRRLFIVTICNYEKYQGPTKLAGGDVGHQTGHQTGQTRIRVNKKGNISKDIFPQKDFERFWEICPRKVGKGAARKAFTRALESASCADLTAAMKRYADSVKGKDLQYVVHPATWLNQERWTDEAPKPERAMTDLERGRAYVAAIKSGYEWVGPQLTPAMCRALLEAGDVTRDELRRVGAND